MKHNDLLETEYKEQYNQYRWIGQMQSHILTFYAAVAVFALAAMAAFLPQDPNPIDCRWPAGVVIGLGVLGILVGFGLFRSRTMQRRTDWYLKSLLIHMAENVEDTNSLNDSAIRFRSLCSTKGRFKMWDTMNISILIAFYSAGFFVLAGSLILSVVMHWVYLSLSQAIVIGLVVFLVLVVAIPVLIQKMMNREAKAMEKEYRDAAKINHFKQFHEHFGLPKLEGKMKKETDMEKIPCKYILAIGAIVTMIAIGLGLLIPHYVPERYDKTILIAGLILSLFGFLVIIHSGSYQGRQDKKRKYFVGMHAVNKSYIIGLIFILFGYGLQISSCF
ncbi:MAG: hypothetical protein MUP30_13050 [Deltaproteobacteria bacterium]|nr:hypothetical protein [Deltaproteobacteria bacterium]